MLREHSRPGWFLIFDTDTEAARGRLRPVATSAAPGAGYVALSGWRARGSAALDVGRGTRGVPWSEPTSGGETIRRSRPARRLAVGSGVGPARNRPEPTAKHRLTFAYLDQRSKRLDEC